MRRFIIAAALSTAAFATPAFAQDAADFSGGYVAVLGGYDKIDFNLAGAPKPDGFLYGVSAGYDFQAGNMVVGVEGEASDSTAKFGTGASRVSAGRDLYIGGRLGVPVGPSALIYGKLGYTNAQAKTVGLKEEFDGIRAGGGVEFKLGGSAFVKGEYRYSNYEAGGERHQVVGGVGFRF